MIMPRLSFEEPKGGPLAKATRRGKHAAPDTEPDLEPDEVPEQDDATVLFEQFTDEPEPEDEPSAERDRDKVVLILRAATIAVAIALVGLIVLLATTGEDDTATNSPGVPQIPASDGSTTPTTSTPGIGAMIAPPVHTQTTEIVPPPVTQPTVPTDTPPPPRDEEQFVRVGEPCDTPGAYAFTERFEPVVCDGGRRGERLAWRRIFR